MRQIEDLTNKVYGKLTVKSFSRKDKSNKIYWWCECSCLPGKLKEIRSDKLKAEKESTKSCGCIKKQQDKLNLGKVKHGFARRGKIALECGIWNKRCTNIKDKGYADYGARGIKVCERWLKFENFINDMGIRPSVKHTIERKNNNGDYCPENCIWATRHVQSRNKRNNIFITLDNETKILKDWTTIYNLSYKQIHAEYRKSPESVYNQLKGLYNAKG